MPLVATTRACGQWRVGTLPIRGGESAPNARLVLAVNRQEERFWVVSLFETQHRCDGAKPYAPKQSVHGPRAGSTGERRLAKSGELRRQFVGARSVGDLVGKKLFRSGRVAFARHLHSEVRLCPLPASASHQDKRKDSDALDYHGRLTTSSGMPPIFAATSENELRCEPRIF